ncbi:hypothetical protein Cni_G20405 [Canna indica]|uniref:ZCF37 n=1 Tax=Canna indica TaxID=4628 RepID=A0AAQ3QJK5_9LILI|nr:hypothetical protein Cni_G20405 [Canna indica]
MLLQAMICGRGSFTSVDDDDPWSTLPSSPKPTKKKATTKNPYSARGLDKFSALRAELEALRANIIARAGGSQGVPMVRFTCSSYSDDWIPIIIKIQDEEKTHHARTPRPPPPAAAKLAASEEITKELAPTTTERKRNKSFCWTLTCKSGRLHCAWPLLVVLGLLLCFLIFGRVFAICCTTVLWYLLPLMEGEKSGMALRRSTKKEYQRRLSSKKLIRGVHLHQEVAASQP